MVVTVFTAVVIISSVEVSFSVLSTLFAFPLFLKVSKYTRRYNNAVRTILITIIFITNIVICNSFQKAQQKGTVIPLPLAVRR